MRGRTTKKNNDKKTEKNKYFRKNVLRNVLCAFAGAAVLTIGIVAPKTIFAMIDQKEIGTIYIREADISYLDTVSQMSMEEKLDLLDLRSTDTHVSSSYPVGSADMHEGDGVASQVEKMQKDHLVPELDFEIRDTSPEVMYETLVNLENMNQYLTLVYMVYQISDDYMYLAVDVETGKILGYTLYVNMTDEEWEALIQADVTAYMAENLGVSEETIKGKYHYSIYNETYGDAYNMTPGGDSTTNADEAVNIYTSGGTQFVQIGMWIEQADDTEHVSILQ